MLDTQEFGDYLQSVGLRDFVGVPCSYLAPLINYAINSKRFIMSNNEGDAVAIASGVSLCRLIHSNSSLGHSACGTISAESSKIAQSLTSSKLNRDFFDNHQTSTTILECQDSSNIDSSNAESQVDSTPCHTEPLGEVSHIESKKDFSPFSKAQNDKNLESQMDLAQNDKNLESQMDSTHQDSSNSKIVSEKCGLQGKSQGSYLSGDLCDFSQLPHLSPQAELPKSAEKPTPHSYGVVLMQNSGLSNALSPLTSLNYTFKIPILGFVSLRGERDCYGKNTDEPQHELLGVITDKLLETCEIQYTFLDSNMDRAKMQVQEALEWLEKGESFFFIVKDKTFSKVALVNGHSACGDFSGNAAHTSSSDARSSASHWPTLHNPKNSLTILECQIESHNLNSSQDTRIVDFQTTLSNHQISNTILECQDSNDTESHADSVPCHTESLGEVSHIEAKRDFSPFLKAQNDKILESQVDSNNTDSKPTQPTNKIPTRLEALTILHTLAKDSKALLLATTGKCGRELYEIEDSPNQLYMVGSMGCVSSLSLGIALKSKQKVIAIDGDSALLMRLGALSTNAYYTRNRDNFCHILLDNESHDSTGGQFNLSPFVDFSSIARSCGYVNVYIAESLEEFELYVRLFLDARNSACGNSSLGSHLQDCVDFEAVITHKVTPAPKFTQNLQSNTALVRSTRKELSGWEIFKGEGATSQFKPFLLKEKNKKSKNQNISNKDTSLTAQYDKVIESQAYSNNTESKKGAWFIYLKIQKGSKENLGRPKITPQEVAQRLSEHMRGWGDEF